MTASGSIRLVNDSDSFDALTDLLHRAYAPLAAQGFRYLATHQDVDTTRRRAARGECYVMVEEAQIVGTIVLISVSGRHPYCAWYDRPEVAVLSQFAIEPQLQGRGRGGALMQFAEQRAQQLGAREVAVDTAEHAVHLLRFYDKRGYREVAREQWEHTNYRSIVLSKALSDAR